MADSVKYQISVQPLEELTEENGGTRNIIASEVGKTLGGSGAAAVTDYSGTAAAQGYKDAAVSYGEAIDDADTDDLSSETTASFVFVRNTGYTYSSATALGASLAKALKIMVGTTLIAVLDPGEPWTTKDDNAGIDCTGIHVRTVDLDGSDNASAGHLAYEYLVAD